MDETVTRQQVLRALRLVEAAVVKPGGVAKLDAWVDSLGRPYAHIAEEALRACARRRGLWKFSAEESKPLLEAAARWLSKLLLKWDKTSLSP